MTTFTNVQLEKKANIYFEGQVTSRTITLQSGEKVTLGIMLPGEYTFNTGAKEIMEITAGVLSYRLVDQDWVKIDGEGVFEVPANSKFDLVIESVTDYCCRYIER